MLDCIAFDADDTLWHSEKYYAEAQERFCAMMEPYGFSREQALETLHRIEIDNLPYFGYGTKGFIFSMIDAAAELTNGQARGADMKALVDIGRWMAGHEVTLLPGAREAVMQLAERHRLMLITKGELMDQERKIQGSGLAEHFRHIEIVSDKTVPTYTRLLARHGIAPKRFLMVGNALRSDILPVLEMGGYAVYVPYEILWAHESNVQLPQADGRYHEIASLKALPGLIEQIDRE